MNSIGFIGFGTMATAIWQGIESSTKDISAVFYRRDRRQAAMTESQFSRLSYADLKTVCAQDILIIAIKPQQLSNLLSTLPASIPKAVISILAGTPIQTFETYFGNGTPIIRVMPNTPCLIQKGMIGIAFNNAVSDTLQQWTTTLFSSIGTTLTVPESAMDVVTAISGSGPAFLYHIANTIAKVGAEHGLSDEDSLTLITQTMIGAGEMLASSNSSPQTLIDAVCSPGGTTVAGLNAFQESHGEHAIQTMIHAAIKRAKELK